MNYLELLGIIYVVAAVTLGLADAPPFVRLGVGACFLVAGLVCVAIA